MLLETIREQLPSRMHGGLQKVPFLGIQERPLELTAETPWELEDFGTNTCPGDEAELMVAPRGGGNDKLSRLQKRTRGGERQGRVRDGAE